MTCVATETDRHLRIGRCFNLRDLGGYASAGGRHVRWRRLFRADGLHRAETAELIAATEVATVLDLRTADEARDHGAFDAPAVQYHHLPILEVLPSAEELERWASPRAVADHYLDMLDLGADSIREAFAILSDPSAYPAVIHCSAGKDRTGVLSALVLGVLGVPGDAIVADYALSGPAMQEMLAWIRSEYPDAGPELERRIPAMVTAEPETMAMFLDGVRRRYGSFRRYTAGLGVASAIPHIRAALLD